MGQIIDERGEGLDAAVTLAEYNLDITKTIKSNIKEQRTDLVAIDNNAGEALGNALEAEKNIEEFAKKANVGRVRKREVESSS